MNELQMLYQGYLANGGNLDFRSYILSLLPAESNTQGDTPTDIPQNINEPTPTEEAGVSPFSTNEYVSEHNAVGVTENQSVNNPIVGNNQVVNNPIAGDSQYPNTQVAGLPIDINSQVVNNQLANNQFAIDEDGQVQSVDNNTYGNVSTYPTNEYQGNEQGSATPTNVTTPTNIQDGNNVETTQQQSSSPVPTEKPKDAIKKYNEQNNILKSKSEELKVIDKQLNDPKYGLIREVDNNLKNISKENDALDEEYKGVTEIPQDIKDIKFKIDNTKETPSERERYEAYINGDYKRYLEYADKKNALLNRFNAEQGRLPAGLANEYSSLVEKRNSVAKDINDTINSDEYKQLEKQAIEEDKNNKKAGNERKKIQYNGQNYIYDPATKDFYKKNNKGKWQRVTNTKTLQGIANLVAKGDRNNGKGKKISFDVSFGSNDDESQNAVKKLADSLNENPSEQKNENSSVDQRDAKRVNNNIYVNADKEVQVIEAKTKEITNARPDENSTPLEFLEHVNRANFNEWGVTGADNGVNYYNNNKGKIVLARDSKGDIFYYHKDGRRSTTREDASDKVAWKIVDKKYFEEYNKSMDYMDSVVDRHNDAVREYNGQASWARLKAEKHTDTYEEFNSGVSDVYKKYEVQRELMDNDKYSSFININDRLWYDANYIAERYVKTHRGVDFNTIRNKIYNELQGGSEQEASAKVDEFQKHYKIAINDSNSNNPEYTYFNRKELQTLENIFKDEIIRVEFGRYLMSKGVPSLNSLNFDPNSRINFLRGFIDYMAGRSKINEEIVKNFVNNEAGKNTSKMSEAQQNERSAKIKAAMDSLEYFRKKVIGAMNLVDEIGKNSQHFQDLTKLNNKFQEKSVNGDTSTNIYKGAGAIITAGLGSISSLIGSVVSGASVFAGIVSKDLKDYLEKNAIIFKDGNFFSDVDFRASIINKTNFFKNSSIIQFNDTFFKKNKNGKYESVNLSEREKANLELADTKHSFSVFGALSTVTRTITDILVTRRIGSAFPFLGEGARDSVSWALYTFGDNYTDGLRSGLSGGKALAYGIGQSVITGLMARISPDEWMFKEVPANAKLALFNSIFGQIGAKRNVAYYKEVFTHFFKSIGKEVASENIQELSELVAGKAFSSLMNKITGSKLDGIGSISKDEILETIIGTTIGTSALAAHNHITNKRDNVIDVNGRAYVLSNLSNRERYALMSNFDIREHVDALKKRFENSPEILETISRFEDKINFAKEYKGEYSEYLPLEDVVSRIKLGQQESKVSNFIDELNKKDSLTDKEKSQLDDANKLLEEKRNAIKELDDKGAVLKEKFGESNKGENKDNNPNDTQDDSLLDENKGDTNGDAVNDNNTAGNENNTPIDVNNGTHNNNVSNNIDNNADVSSNKPNNIDNNIANDSNKVDDINTNNTNNNKGNNKVDNKQNKKGNKNIDNNVDSNTHGDNIDTTSQKKGSGKGTTNNNDFNPNDYFNNNDNNNTNTNTNLNDKNKDINRNSYDDKFEGLDREPIKTTRNGKGYTKRNGVWSKDDGKKVKGKRAGKEVKNRDQIDNLDSDAYNEELKRLEKRKAKLYKDYKKDKGISIFINSKEVSNNNIHKVLKDIDSIINFYSLKDVKGKKASKILNAIKGKGYYIEGIDLKKIIEESLKNKNKGVNDYFEKHYNDKHKGLKDIDDAYDRAKSKLEDKYKHAKRKAKFNNKNNSNKGDISSSDEKINIKDEKNTIFGDKNKDKGDIANKEESEKPKKESKKENNVASKPKKEKEDVKDKDALDEEKQELLKEKNKLYRDLEDAVELSGKKKDLESIISKIESELQKYKKKAESKNNRTEQEIKDDNRYIDFVTESLEDYKRRLAELEDSMDKLGLKGVDINKLKRDTSKAVKDIDNKLRDITNRRKDVEASENANIEPNNNSDKVSDSKSDSNTSLNKDRADDVFMMDISDIHTDEKRFQGRDKLNEDAVERIAKNFNYKDQDPIHIWKDPKNGKYYVLSGHHRLEGAKRADGITKVKVVDKSADFKTEEEAINFAKREANYNRTQETVIESANTLRDLINQERNETDKGKLEKIRTQIKDFLKMLMANATSVRNLAYLNPKGKVISTLKNLERSNDDTYNFVLGRAKWIGAVREKYPVITDEHERELFDSLMSEEGVKAITNKGDFLKKVGDIVKSSNFDAKLPINILNLTSKSYLETEWEEKMKELESEKKSYENKINELEGRFNDPTRDDFVNINDPYYKEKRAYADMEIESLKGKIANINNKINAHYKNKSEVDKFVKNQLSIFDDSDLFNSSNESDNNNENINNNKDEEQSKSKGISDTKPLGEKKSGQSGNLFEQEDESERGDNRGRQGVGDNDAGARPLSRHNEPLGGETESESGKAVGDVFDKKSGRDIQDNEHSDEQQDKGNSDNAILEDRGRSREESDVSGVNVDEKKAKDSKKVTNEDIDREVEELTSVDDKTKLVSVNGEVSTEAKGRLAQYKSGGESKKGRGILDEYYTNTKIVNAIGNLIKGLFNGKGDIKVLEPSIGTGNFLSLLSKLGVKSDVTAFEINRTTAGISAINYPNAKIYNRSYETEFVDEKGEQKNIVGRYGKYDLVIGNPPYGERSGYIKGLASSKDENVEEAKINKWEDYFVKRSLDQLREGGILAMVLPSGWINRQKNINAELVGAYRLPNGVFGGTNVGTDIIILRKGKLGNDGIDISNYFEENPSHILGEVSKGAGQWGSDLVKGNLEDAIERLKDLHKDAFDGDTDSDTDVNKHLIKNTDNKVNEEENSTGDKDAKTNKDNSDKEKGGEENANDYVVQDSPKINKKDLKYHFVKNDEQVSANTLNDTNNISEKEANALRQTDYKGEFKELTDDVKPYANMIDGKWVHDFYYAEGNIYEKLEKLENEKHKMPQSQYEKQKALLESVKPKPKGINDIDITPNHEIVSDFKFVDAETDKIVSLADAFINYLGGLPSEAFGSSSYRDVYEYVKNQRVTGNDATDNTRRRKARKEVGEYLFKQFLEKELPKVVVDSFLNEFNRVYNNLHTPDHSKFPLFAKVNKNFKGKPLSLKIVQKAGIGRLTAKGVGLLAHEVGFGKTLSGIIAIHEAMERGNAKRPVIVVPNDNILEQWVETIYETIPNAKVNILGNLGSKVDLSNFEVRDGEITIITEAGLKNIGFPEDIVNKYSKDFTYISKELDSTPRKEEQLKEKSEELAGRLVGGSKYNWLDFGFDHLTFDEAHHANHIVEGVKVEARNSSDFRHLKQAKSNLGIITWIASRYIQEKNNGRNVTLLTATPFTNKPLEIYSILSLMGNDRLKEMGFFNVNNFFETFIDASYNMEVDSRGNVVEKVSVRGFKNNGLLQLLFSEYIDFKGEADNPDLIRPNKQNEEYKVEPNSLTNEMMSLNQKLLSSKDAGSLLKGITNGRMIAVSPYLSSQYEGVIPDAKEYVENSPKLKATMDLIAQNKKDNPNAGQIIYSEIGTDVFPKLKEYLVNELGYKDSEVAIIDGKTKGREKIQDDYNKGKVKILIGSSTIQAGMNLQFNTSDMYILSLPYNFTALKQLEGRAWRQGNKWENLRVNYMLTNNSSDVFLLQRIQEKQERYNNLKQTNASRVDVSDIDAEELKFSLITDPVKRAEAEYSLDKQKLEYQKKVITQELSVKYRLFDRLESLKNELQNPYHVASIKDRKRKEIKAVENKIKETGLSYDDYENAKAKADKETGVIDKKLEELKEQFPALIAKYKKEVEERESNVKETDFTSKRAEDNKTFYKLREEESKDVKNDKQEGNEDVKKVASDESKHNKDGEGVQFQKQSDATKSEFRKVEKGKFMEFIDKAKAFLSNNPSFKNSRVFFDKKEFAKRTGNEEAKYFKTSDGHIYGAKFPNGDIYFDEDVLNYNTAIHEFSHLWEQMFPKSWAKGLELFKQTKTAEAMVSKMKKEGNNNHLTEEQMYSEAMNTYIGNKGEAMQWNNEEVPSRSIDKFKKWFSDLMAKVGQRFGFDKRYDRDMTATDKFGEFADSVINDITGGKAINAERYFDEMSNEHIIDLFKDKGIIKESACRI